MKHKPPSMQYLALQDLYENMSPDLFYPQPYSLCRIGSSTNPAHQNFPCFFGNFTHGESFAKLYSVILA